MSTLRSGAYWASTLGNARYIKPAVAGNTHFWTGVKTAGNYIGSAVKKEAALVRAGNIDALTGWSAVGGAVGGYGSDRAQGKSVKRSIGTGMFTGMAGAVGTGMAGRAFGKKAAIGMTGLYAGVVPVSAMVALARNRKRNGQ